jgi:hypothetical protein
MILTLLTSNANSWLIMDCCCDWDCLLFVGWIGWFRGVIMNQLQMSEQIAISGALFLTDSAQFTLFGRVFLQRVFSQLVSLQIKLSGENCIADNANEGMMC